MSRLVIIDDDRDWCRSLVIQLKLSGHEAVSAHNGADGEELITEFEPDLVLLDLRLGTENGLEVLEKLREDGLKTSVVMVTGEQDMEATIRAGQLGVLDYLRKPFELDHILELLTELDSSALGIKDKLIPVEAPKGGKREIVGADRQVTSLLQQIGRLAQSRVNVMIAGESGTGKEYVARALHEHTAPDEPFIAINCTTVVSGLLESELFGHEKGAFTGADKIKIGKFEAAAGGTVFLDEIGDMPLDLQGKLLRVIQEREFERVGGIKSIPFNARIIAATHRDLGSLAEEGTFREDLFYRLNVATLELPPLRERPGDIPLLVTHLLGKIAQSLHRKVRGITPRTMEQLTNYSWPGNIRELENMLTRAVALASDGVIRETDFHLNMCRTCTHTEKEDSPLRTLREAEKRYIARSLTHCAWNISKTAEVLDITRTTLRKKINDYGLARPS